MSNKVKLRGPNKWSFNSSVLKTKFKHISTRNKQINYIVTIMPYVKDLQNCYWPSILWKIMIRMKVQRKEKERKNNGKHSHRNSYKFFVMFNSLLLIYLLTWFFIHLPTYIFYWFIHSFTFFICLFISSFTDFNSCFSTYLTQQTFTCSESTI